MKKEIVNYFPTFWGTHNIDEDLKDYDFKDGDIIVFEVNDEVVFENKKYHRCQYFLEFYYLKEWHLVEKLTAHLEEKEVE